MFHGTGNSAQLCQNFWISGGGGVESPKPPLGTPLLCPRQWTQHIRAWKSWQGLDPAVTLWHCQIVATERHFCTLAHLELISRSTNPKKHYPVQDHEFIGTWHWQRPLTAMVTIRTTRFNIEEIYILPLESVCFVFRLQEVGHDISLTVYANRRVKTNA
jgi:hypothetical protein